MVSSLGMAFGPGAGGIIFDGFNDYRWLYIGSLRASKHLGTQALGHASTWASKHLGTAHKCPVRSRAGVAECFQRQLQDVGEFPEPAKPHAD
jgi:hypothetical protein